MDYDDSFLLERIASSSTAQAVNERPEDAASRVLWQYNRLEIDSGGFDNASVPRSGVATEQIQNMRSQLHGLAELDNEVLHPLYNHGPAELEPEYVVEPRRIEPRTAATKAVGPLPEEWNQRKCEIYDLYMTKNWQCSAVAEEMAKRGFHATSVLLPLFLTRPVC